jgi:hypothetical protein
MKHKYITCTFCNRLGRESTDAGCCISCNVSLSEPGGFESILSSRKCRGCRARLPQTRYFNCEDCEPIREPESEFDHCDSVDDGTATSLTHIMAQKRAEISPIQIKTCIKCKTTRTIEHFGLAFGTVGGRRNTCRPCEMLRARLRRQKLKIQINLEKAS